MNKMCYTLLLGFVLACSGPSKEEQKLFNEAASIHNGAVERAGKLKDQLKRLEEDSLINQDSVLVLLAALNVWSEDLVEVPGNEAHHHHDEDDDHHHHHGKQDDISAQEMLAVQQEISARLSQLEERAKKLSTTK